MYSSPVNDDGFRTTGMTGTLYLINRESYYVSALIVEPAKNRYWNIGLHYHILFV